MIKSIFFDIDGTILGKSGEISKDLPEILQQYKNKGVRYGVATGRPLFAAKKIIESIKANGPSMVFSGALIVDPLYNKPIYESLLSKELVNKFTVSALNKNFYVEAYNQNTYFSFKENEYEKIHSLYLDFPPVRVDLDFIKEEKIYKLEVMIEKGAEEARFREFIKDFPEFTYGFASGPKTESILFCNITNSEATRKNAWDILLKYLNLHPSEVAAFGDSEQDGYFIENAGYGVAMETSPDSVLKKAKFTAKSVENDGVTELLTIWANSSQL